MTELELLRKEYDQLNSRHNLLLERLARHFSNPIWHVESLGLSSDDIVKAGLYNEDGLYGMFPFQTSDPKPSSTKYVSSAPAGWKLVPIVPTREMLDATSWPACAASDWQHMTAAAPEIKK